MPVIRDGAYLVCRGHDCPAQVAGAIRRWVEKLSVLHFGAHLVEALIEAELVGTIPDLYTVDVSTAEALVVDGRRLGGVATRGFENLNRQLELPLWLILGSLGIPLIGRSTARTIVDGLGLRTLLDVYCVEEDEVAALDGIGPARAASFVRGVEEHRRLLDRLLQVGVTIKRAQTGVLTGQSFCMSGGRWPDLAAALEAAGAVQKSSVGKGLTFLIVKDPTSGSAKVQAAQKHGTNVVSPGDAWALLA